MKNLLLLIFLFSGQLFAQGVWTRKADFPGNHQGTQTMQFMVIGTKAYIFMFRQTPVNIIEVWEYENKTNNWTQRSNFPGIYSNYYHVCTSIDNLGYFGIGYDKDTYYEFWEYNSNVDKWSSKASFIDILTHDKYATFVLNGKVYFGFSSKDLRLWSYNPATDEWVVISGNAPLYSFGNALVFTIGNIAYIGGGYSSMQVPTKILFAYEPVSNVWLQKKDLPNSGLSNGFSICEYGYAIDSCLYQYKPATNTWKRKLQNPFVVPGGYNIGAAFSIGKKGYILLKNDSLGNPSPALWEYTPDDSCTLYNGLAQEEEELSFSISPNPLRTYATLSMNIKSKEPFTFSLYQMNGVLVKKMMGYTHEPLEIQREDLPAGMYYYQVALQNKQATGKIILAD